MIVDVVWRAGEITLMRAKACLGCGVMTKKVGGCDHIACMMKGCGAH
jgi:hypothetical protein